MIMSNPMIFLLGVVVGYFISLINLNFFYKSTLKEYINEFTFQTSKKMNELKIERDKLKKQLGNINDTINCGNSRK